MRSAPAISAGARERFEHAVSLEPDTPSIHAALARTLDALGYDDRASGEAQRALDLSGGLSHEDLLVAEWARDLAVRDWNKAMITCRALGSLFPDRLDYALGLLEVERRSTTYEAGEETLAAVRRLPAPMATDPQVNLAEAALALARGDAARARAAAEVARRKAAESGAKAVLIRALLQRSLAEARLGDRAGAGDDLAEVTRVAAERGDDGDVTRAREALAQLRADEAKLDEAEALLEQSRVDHERRGREGRIAETLAAMAALERRKGDDRGARARYEEALAHDLLRGANKREIAATRTSLGELLAEMGELSLASEQHDAALALRRELHSGTGESESLAELSGLALAAGDVTLAWERAESALTRAIAANARAREAGARQMLAEVLVARGDSVAGRNAFEQACGALRNDGSSAEALCRVRYATALGDGGLLRDALAQVERAESVVAAREGAPVPRENRHRSREGPRRRRCQRARELA